MKIGISTASFLTACPKRTALFRAYVASMQSQFHDDWMVVFVHDGPAPECIGLDAMREALRDPRFSYVETPEAKGHWGHPNRQIGIDACLEAGCGWLGFSNDDNYYTPDWLSACMHAAKTGANFAYCDISHSHLHYRVLNSQLRPGEIDMGAFLLTRELVEDVRWDSMDLTQGAADGRYVVAVTNHQHFQPEKISRVLFVHN